MEFDWKDVSGSGANRAMLDIASQPYLDDKAHRNKIGNYTAYM